MIVKKLISHRGNIDGPKPTLENTLTYIDAAICSGYDVEIDVWKIGDELFLGHDGPEHKVKIENLTNEFRRDFLWVHCKNFDALQYLIDYNLKIFYHQKENHTIINKCNIIWSHNLTEANYKSIIPLLSEKDINDHDLSTTDVYGICSDYVNLLREKS